MPRRAACALSFGLIASLVLFSACGGSKPAGPSADDAVSPAAAPAATESAQPATPETPEPAAQEATAPKTQDDESLDPATAAGAVRGVPAPTNTAAIEAVANFYTELPGFDLSKLPTHQREKFLHRVNSELCTCGCKNDTLARCLVNDPRCPVVKGLVQSVYDEVTSGR